MEQPRHPFQVRPGFGGVIVRFADKRWYLREWHSHPALEMNLVVRGTGSILLEDRRYPLLPGHLVWLWPGQRHVPARWSADMLMWIVEWWDGGYLGKLKRARRGVPRPGDTQVYACRRVDELALQRLQGVLGGAAAAEQADTFNHGLHFALLTLWDEFVRGVPVAREEFLHPRLERVLALLNDPANDMMLAELAKESRLSASHLSLLFRQQTGLTIPAYRNRLRLNAFFALHRQRPEIRLLELALEAGFGSYAQFYRVFTEAVGQTPRRWLVATRE